MSNTISSYLIDTDVLVTAKNRYYAFSICPGFWDSLLHAYESGTVHSIDRVRDEVLKGRKDEDLVQWVRQRVPKDFFKASDDTAVIESYQKIILWSQQHDQYKDAAKTKFARGADGWLVAYCQVNGTCVVTNEESAPDSKKDIKLPDVCNAFNVRFEDTFAMLHKLNVQYHFSPTP